MQTKKNIWIVMICIQVIVKTQNLDVYPESWAGVAVTEGVNALYSNPAGLGKTPFSEVLIFQDLSYFSYYLINIRQSQKFGETFNWGKSKIYFPNLLIKHQLKPGMALGLGYVDYISPFLNNERRAITWSTLFSQETSGTVRAFMIGAGLNNSPRLSTGFNISRYYGHITSIIQGDNHKLDQGKWLKTRTRLSGWNLKFATQFKLPRTELGFTVSTPLTLKTKSKSTISQDSTYNYLVSDQNNPDLMIPLNINLGFAFALSKNIMISIDIYTYRIDSKGLKLNIFEYGGNPNWKNGLGFHTGINYLPAQAKGIPLKFVYAFKPQPYASIHAWGEANTIFGYMNKEQNFKHYLIMSSTFKKYGLIIDYGFKFSFLSWRRNLDVTGFMVEETYHEKEYNIFINIVYTIPQNK